MQLNQRRFSMRICLTDVIGTDNEKILMTYLNELHTKFEVPVLLKFWYNEGKISDKKLDNFVRNYKHILAKYGTKIYTLQSLKNMLGDEAWFNVTTAEGFANKKRTFRFTYVFDDIKSPLWGCVNCFVDLVNFHTKEKPEKKPFKKRTFNEGSNRRKS